MDTLSKIRDIFYSGSYAFSGDEETIKEIAFLVSNDYLRLDSFPIASKAEYFRKTEEVTSNPSLYDEATGGGHGHMALKLITAKFLEGISGQKMKFEQSFCGYFPDILSADKKTVAECGHTQNAEKILAYFSKGKIRECIQVPYPNLEDFGVLGYRFTPESSLTGFLNVLERNKNANLRTALSRRETKRDKLSH